MLKFFDDIEWVKVIFKMFHFLPCQLLIGLENFVEQQPCSLPPSLYSLNASLESETKKCPLFCHHLLKYCAFSIILVLFQLSMYTVLSPSIII